MSNYRNRSKFSNFACFKKHRECYGNSVGIEHYQSNYMNTCFNLYSHKLFGHYGCVNAIEFSNGTCDLLASGGDDKRVLLWDVNECLFKADYKPVRMSGTHVSNIFCIAFIAGNNKVLSSGNDEMVMIHDVPTRQVVSVFLREDAVYSISAHPSDHNLFITASEGGMLRMTDLRDSNPSGVCLANYVSAFHGVAFNPMEPLFVAAAHSKEGAALWDIRKPKSTVLCYGSSQPRESAMSVQFNRVGTRLLVLRRKKFPRIYKTHSDVPFVDGESDRYFNSCTMKSGCFAGVNDEYFVSGSDDFKVYLWKIPDGCEDKFRLKVMAPRMVLRGHRSIVNQVRFNEQSQTLVSSGVEKYLNMWSPFKYPHFVGQNEEPSCEHSRAMYSRHQYIDLVLRSGTTLTHDYETESVGEDPRMIAFFDSLLQHDRNQSSGTDSYDDDDSLANLRLLPQMMATIRPDGIRNDISSSSEAQSTSSDDSSSDEDERPGEESLREAMKKKPTINKQTQTRLHNLRQSLRSADSDVIELTERKVNYTEDTSESAETSLAGETPEISSTKQKKGILISSDNDSGDRNSAMRKRNAGRKRKRIKSIPQSSSATPADTKINEKSNSDTSSTDSESDYVRTKRKLRRSIEATNRRLQNIADEMATAIENAPESTDSDSNNNNFNGNIFDNSDIL